MTTSWLSLIAWASLIVAAVCAAVILVDIYGRGFRQPMGVMEAVWPVTALYWGPVALWLYIRHGRSQSPKWLDHHRRSQAPPRPNWVPIASGVSHCGAGCTLGDILAASVVFVLGLEILGRTIWPEMIGDYLAALTLGILFQYFAIAPMRGLGVRDGLAAAAKADVLSLTAFEVGLFGWMAIMTFVIFPSSPLQPDSPVYWLFMQVGMIIGFITAWPANVWLIRRGVKEAM